MLLYHVLWDPWKKYGDVLFFGNRTTNFLGGQKTVDGVDHLSFTAEISDPRNLSCSTWNDMDILKNQFRHGAQNNPP